MRKKTSFMRVFWLISAFLLGMQGFAQEIVVTGSVQDQANGETMPGVTVLLKGTNTGSVTSITGEFSVKAKVGDVLVISSIGYASQEVAIASAAPVKVSLVPEAIGLNDVVVIGYGSVKKSDATGAITTVSSKDFNKGVVTSPADLLMGKSAGVTITSGSGDPTGGPSIRIRGASSLSASNDPLIIVDGMPLDNSSANVAGMPNGLASINPNDIESFTVLKDASATAIYGSRASAGVILITTKRGAAGQAMKVNYSGNVSVSTPAAYADVLTGDEYRAMAKSLAASGKVSSINPTSVATLDSIHSTDWQKEIFRTAISHDHNISITGTQYKTPYRASMGYTDQQGILRKSGFQRMTGAVGVDPSFFNGDLKVNLNAKGSVTLNQFGEPGAVGAAVNFDPTQPVMNGNTRFAGYTTSTTGVGINTEGNANAPTNPVAMINLTENNSRVTRVIANSQFDYKVRAIPGLRANLNLAIDAYDSKLHNNADSTLLSTLRQGKGRLTDETAIGGTQLFDFYLNYTKDLESLDSKIDVTGGYSWQYFYREGSRYQRGMYADPKTNLVAVVENSAFKTRSYTIGFFGRLNYTLKNKYLFTATVRDDASSRFESSNRWAIFPSAALAWKINEESFVNDVSVISELKLRLGWGQTGQQNIPTNDFPYLPTYRQSQESARYQFGNSFENTYAPMASMKILKWETTTTQNVGLDYGLWDNRISGSIDVYKRVTDDLLNFADLPSGSSYTNQFFVNTGSMENNGVEVSLNLRPISTKDVSWLLAFNGAYNKTEITKLSATDDPTYLGNRGGSAAGTGQPLTINSIGYSPNSFFVAQQVYGSNGIPLEGVYVNRSGSAGTVYTNVNNYYRNHSATPDYTFGISSRVNYKAFDFSFSGRLSLNNYVYNSVAASAFYTSMNTNGYWANINRQVEGSQFVAGTTTYLSDYFVQNASFFRMDNISLGYSFNKIVTEKLKGHIGLTVLNAFVITKYKGMDPEVRDGNDNNVYPRPRTFMLSLNLDL